MKSTVRFEAFGVAVCLTLVGLAASEQAAAQEGGRLERLSAEALFNEGLRLMQANDYVSACPKLAASYRLDPGIGTLLYLADCYDSEGKTASAWITFREAVFLARKAGDTEREQAALEHADALRPKLTSLQLQMATPPAGLTLTLDEHAVATELLNVPLPVDPGQHVLVASAPNYVSWSQSFTIEPTPTVVPFTIPPLASTQTPAPPAAPAVEQPRGASNLDALGWVAVGVGATAIVGGGAAILAGVDPWPRPIVVCGIGVLSVVGGTLLLTLPSEPQGAPREPRGGARKARSEPSGWGLGWQASF
ncbi:MAG: hypothetical protein JW940_30710 [Polyangiaceae bacterium]|nr:hypothetical protein [Polyangiaceae bacterium]